MTRVIAGGVLGAIMLLRQLSTSLFKSEHPQEFPSKLFPTPHWLELSPVPVGKSALAEETRLAWTNQD